VNASQILGEAVQALAMIPLFVPPFTLLVVLASSTSGDQHFLEIVTLRRQPPHHDWRRSRTAGNRFARDDKAPGPS
jgi:hypothetical protein